MSSARKNQVQTAERSENGRQDRALTISQEIHISPSSLEIEKLHQLSPSYAEKCIAIYEKQQDHENAMNVKMSNHNNIRAYIGLVASILVTVGCIIATVVLANSGTETSRSIGPYVVLSSIALGTPLLSFLRAKRPNYQ